MIRRIYWLAVNAANEMLRDPALIGLFFVGLLMILSGRILADLTVAESTRLIIDTGTGAIMLIGIMVSLYAGTNLIDREIRERQVFCTLSKPITRTAWLAGKTFGLIAILALMIGALDLFLFFFVWLTTGAWMFRLLHAGFLIFLMTLVLSGYTILFSTLTSQFMALFYGLCVAFIGHMVDDLRVYWDSKAEAARFVSKGLYYILPDLESFSPWPIVSTTNHMPGSLSMLLVLYALAYLVIPVTIAALVIERREFH